MKFTKNRLLESGARTEYNPLTLNEIGKILENQEKLERVQKIISVAIEEDGYIEPEMNLSKIEQILQEGDIPDNPTT